MRKLFVVLAGVFLFSIPGIIQAQEDAPLTKDCPDCNKIQTKIDTKNGELEKLKDTKIKLSKKISDLNGEIHKTGKSRKNAKKALEDFLKPKSWISAEDRTITSSDLKAQRYAFNNAWQKYQDGNMSAQELENLWKNFSKKDLKKATKDLETKLRKNLQNAKDTAEKLKKDIKKLTKELDKVNEKIKDLNNEIDKLQDDLDDCLKNCGIGFWDSFFGIFSGLKIDFGPTPEKIVITAGIALDTAGQDIVLPPSSGIDLDALIEELKQSETGTDFNIDSFFDVFTELSLPENPTDAVLPPAADNILKLPSLPELAIYLCPECADIAEKLKKLEDQIDEIWNAADELDEQIENLDIDIKKAWNDFHNAERAVDEFIDGGSWGAGWGGATTSADMTLKKRALKKLWKDYGNGDATAEDIQNFDENFDLDKARKEHEAELKAAEDAAETRLNELQEARDAARKKLYELEDQERSLGLQADWLHRELENCEDQCNKKDDEPVISVMPDFGLMFGEDWDKFVENLITEPLPVPEIIIPDFDLDISVKEIQELFSNEEWDQFLADNPWVKELIQEEKEEENKILPPPKEDSSIIVDPSLIFIDEFEAEGSKDTSKWNIPASETPDQPVITDPKTSTGLQTGDLEIEPLDSEPDCGSQQFHGDPSCNETCWRGTECVIVDGENECYDCMPVNPITKCPNIGEHYLDCGMACFSNQRCVPKSPGSDCMVCITIPTDLPDECSHGLDTLSECENSCNGTCVYEETIGSLKCYDCETPPPPPEPTCPSGSIPDLHSCNDQCDNGTCSLSSSEGDLGCYTCTKCPDGTYSSESACTSGDNECEVVASEGELQCWQEKASCEELCTEYDFSATSIDFTSHVESILNEATCVSSYQMTIQTAKVGDCECFPTTPPQIGIDRTPPICKDTVCGDVICGGSETCSTGTNTTTTVNCNWGGWKKEKQYEYSPILKQ
ncbi:MAG: hypothetical protein OEL89_01660 [Candidatus Peregrinibacteria bacterium]|nr:hypothetical protein [Candidatus Peregrinibacteria bacterium]